MGATLFSGIDAPEVSTPAIDWLWRAEIDKFPSAVSKHRRPDTPNLGDVSAPDFVERALQHGRPDVIVFGSPCQSFSVAGKRLGLDDPRGNLALVALEVVRQLRPRWLVFENVPGLFSSEKGRDFAAFLGAVEQCGYLGAWRVLDAQYAGVPQRRRRLFFVGHLGDWRPAAAVLFERESLQGHPAPRRETGEGVAAGSLRSTDGGVDVDHAAAGHVVAHSLRAEGFDASEDGTGRGAPLVPVGFYPTAGREFPVFDDMSPAVKVGSGGSSGNPPGVVAFETRFARNGRGAPDTVVPPLKAQSGQSGKGDAAPCVVTAMQVRRLTPRECERLQGFPDDYSQIPWRGKGAEKCPDGPRYKSLGNSMAVPVIGWILDRVQKVERLT